MPPQIRWALLQMELSYGSFVTLEPGVDCKIFVLHIPSVRQRLHLARSAQPPTS